MSVRTILLVEDDPTFAVVALTLLCREGYEVIHVSSGEAAIDQVRVGISDISLILMDISLGEGMDGIEAAREIRKEHDIPLIFLSSHVEPEVLERTEKITSYGYVVKNTGIPVLVASIKMAFQLHEANQTIRRMNETLRIAQEAGNAGTWDWDITRNEIHWSPEFLKLFDMSAGTKSGFEAWEKAVHPDDLKLAREKIQESIAHRTKLTNEYRIVLSSGEIRWILATGKTFYEGNHPARMIGLCMDITERKQREFELQEGEQRLRNLADNLPNTVVYQLTSEDGGGRCFTYVSRGVERLNERTVDEVLRDAGVIYGQVSPEYLPLVKQREAEAIKRLGTFQVEVLSRLPSGCLRWFEYSSTPRYLPNGLLVWDGVQVDVTDRKQTEERLRFQAMILNQISDMVTATDLDGIITYVNEAAVRNLGYDRSELLGRSLEYCGEHSRYGSIRSEMVARTLSEGKWHGEIVQRAARGRDILVDCRAQIIRNPEGHSVGLCAIGTNITERRQAEEALRKKSEEVERYFTLSLDLLCIAGTDGEFIRLNPEWEKVLGYPLVELEGRSFLDFVHPEDVPATLEAVAALEAQREVLNLENRYRCKDGSLRWIAWRAIPHGKLIYAVARDMTQRRQAEEALSEVTNRLSLAMRAGAVGIWDLDVLHNKLTWDDQMHVLCGAARESFHGIYESWKKSLHPDDLEKADAEMQMALQGRQEFDTEFRVIWPDSTIRNIRSMAKVMRDSSGQAVRMIGTSWDITAQKQTESALQESIDNFRLFFETISDLIIVGTPDGRILFTNSATGRKLGYREEELCTMHLLDLYPQDKRREAEEIFSDMFRGERDSCPLPIVGKNGMLIPVETRIWSGKWNHAECIFSIIKDLTGEQEAQQRFERLFRNNPSLMALSLLPDRLFVEVNEAFCSATGYSRNEVLGKSSADLGLFVDDPRQKALAARLRTEGHVVNQELQIRRKDGSLRHGLFSGEVVNIQGRQHFLTVMIDLTEQKKGEEERKNLQAQLNQIQKMESVGRLAGGVAHDFNNMLGVILGHTEMALNRLDPAEPIFTDLQEIRKAAQRSADLTRQLLTFARKQMIVPQLLDLNETVEGMLKMLRRLIGENIDLAWLPVNGAAPVKVDPSQIDQILANLCVNARDAISGIGKIVIETEIVHFAPEYCAHHPGFAPGDYVSLAVIDDGCGMDKETQDKLFEPFFTTKELGKGTGLGLATVYGIVQQNKGFLHVQSVPDQGTTFRIYLPLYNGDVEQTQKRSPEEPYSAVHETILLVEDEHAILAMITTLLRHLGYFVLATSSPKESLRLAEEHTGKIHLLMTDVVMPEMNGLDLAKQLQSLHPNLKRLFMSGYTADVISRHGVLDPDVHFIQKPFSIKALQAKIREVLNQA